MTRETQDLRELQGTQDRQDRLVFQELVVCPVIRETRAHQDLKDPSVL